MRNLMVFSTDKLPENRELMATVANGYVGSRIFSDTVYISGVFNGKTITSHRARIPSTLPTKIVLPGEIAKQASRVYTLNTEHGVFLQEVNSKDGSFSIYQRTYAHRKLSGAIITEVRCENRSKNTLSFTLDCEGSLESSDLDITVNPSTGYSILHGLTKEAETEKSSLSEIAVIWSPGKTSHTIHVKPTGTQENFLLVSAYASSLDSKDPIKKAKETYDKVYKIWKDDPETLYNLHKDEWLNIWKSGCIDIEGDEELAEAVYGSMYYILSSIRADWHYGLSPGGLPSDGYMGHTFWDQDTWMFPPLLLFHDDLAQSALQYRIDRIGSAKERALKYGYKGTMFPWESALTGFEVCPQPDPYSKYEHHVTGDVGFAAQQYWMATHDMTWLNEKGSHLIEGVANFWASRVLYIKERDVYVIDHVQGPDEYEYDINNSVYTNVIAKMNLEFAFNLFTEVGIPARQEWKEIAAKMYIPFDQTHNYHPEYDGYTLDTTVKQADVILLGFPLMYDMPKAVRKNDVALYEPRTDPDGPAMTKSMFAVGWLDIGDDQEAARSFKEGYANIKEPFKVWTETPQGGEINFITGAGGFLQSVVFGYGGIRIHLDKLSLDPKLPGTATTLSLKGLKYLGNILDISLSGSEISVALVDSFTTHFPLVLHVKDSGESHKLLKGTHVTFDQGPAFVARDKVP